MSPITLPPFLSEHQLRSQLSPSDFELETHAVGPEDERTLSSTAVSDFLHRELDTPLLNELYPHLWLVAKKSGHHIDAIHQQRIQGRNITIAENPALHLIWYYDTLYLKPIPQCLFNHAFWEDHLLPSTKMEYPGIPKGFNPRTSHICRTALGYLRSYSLLIRHESDYLIAQRADLIPKNIPYQAFKRYIHPFRSIPDSDVSPRYHFGQLRLTRLNLAVQLFRPPSSRKVLIPNYHNRNRQTGDFLRRFGTPLLFFFAAFSVVLSAMQVALAALGQEAWAAFVRASWGFSIAVIILIAASAAICTLGLLGFCMAQGQFALRMRRQEKKVAAARPASA